MRLALLLGCLFVLLLSVKPCCADEKCAAATKTTQAHAKGSATKPCEGCSPFVTCGTCMGFVTATPLAHNLTVLHTEIKPAPIPAYLQPYVQEASQSIWQPPQLG